VSGQWDVFAAGVQAMTLPEDTQSELHIFAAKNGASLRCSLFDAAGQPVRVLEFRRVPDPSAFSTALTVEVMLTVHGCTRWLEWGILSQPTAAAAIDVVLLAASSSECKGVRVSDLADKASTNVSEEMQKGDVLQLPWLQQS
jgi:hypothetical protein